MRTPQHLDSDERIPLTPAQARPGRDCPSANDSNNNDQDNDLDNIAESWQSYIDYLLWQWQWSILTSGILLVMAHCISTPLFLFGWPTSKPPFLFATFASMGCITISLVHGAQSLIVITRLRTTFPSKDVRHGRLGILWTCLSLPGVWLAWSIITPFVFYGIAFIRPGILDILQIQASLFFIALLCFMSCILDMTTAGHQSFVVKTWQKRCRIGSLTHDQVARLEALVKTRLQLVPLPLFPPIRPTFPAHLDFTAASGQSTPLNGEVEYPIPGAIMPNLEEEPSGVRSIAQMPQQSDSTYRSTFPLLPDESASTSGESTSLKD